MRATLTSALLRGGRKPNCGTTASRGSRSRKGFTLIEVLVVVAIIALLISILLPSLARAREIARITICKTGLQQVGTNVANYQAEYLTYVPVLFGFGNLTGFGDDQPENPAALAKRIARTQLLSVALHKYSAQTRRLPAGFDPETLWTNQQKSDYMRKTMPPYYSCPFVRDSSSPVTVDKSEVRNIGNQQYTVVRVDGHRETYTPFQWDGRVIRGVAPTSNSSDANGELMPPDTGGPANGRLIDGRPKYSAISFNHAKIKTVPYPYPPGFLELNDSDPVHDPLNDMARKWSTADARRLKAAGFSDLTMILCSQGSHVRWKFNMYNPGSHRMNEAGGTNTVFADNHVEWVKWTMIGWQ